VIGIIAACAALVLFLGICCLYVRRRRLRGRATQLPQVSYGRMRKQSSNLPKQSYVSDPSGYHAYHQTTPPTPPPLYIPRYPPRGYDTRHTNSQSQWPSSSNVQTIPEPVTPVSLRAPSGVTSRPISSLDTAPLPLRSSVRRDESITVVSRPSSPPSSASLRSPQRNVVGSPLPPLHPSPLPRSLSVVIPPPASPPSPHPSGAIPPSRTARPFALAPTDTGTSNNNDEAPPAYTPL
jgi:hypothetical protein